MDNVLLTVFTPTYNRAHTLPRTYDSLLKQNDKCFEWLIIDDGSTDQTAELVKSWIKRNNGFKIRYLYKENGGMHTAYNMAYDNINTELNVCIDSDDCLAEGAAKRIKDFWGKVKDKNYSGIIGLDADMEGNIIGDRFPSTLKETNCSEYYASGGRGDKKFVFRTDIIKKYPRYPEFEGEKYVGISCKFVMIDQHYKMAVLNEVLCNVEYQIDGSSNTMYRQYVQNPKGFAYYRKVRMKYPNSKKGLIIETVHYISSSLIAGNHKFIRESPRKPLTVVLTPAGFLLKTLILYRYKKTKR